MVLESFRTWLRDQSFPNSRGYLDCFFKSCNNLIFRRFQLLIFLSWSRLGRPTKWFLFARISTKFQVWSPLWDHLVFCEVGWKAAANRRLVALIRFSGFVHVWWIYVGRVSAADIRTFGLFYILFFSYNISFFISLFIIYYLLLLFLYLFLLIIIVVLYY